MKPRVIINEGLKKLQPDKRDYSYEKVFGAPIIDLPDEFILDGLEVKDQGMSDFCAAYCVSSASEFQEKIELNPEWQFSQIKRIMGEWQSWGADLRSACKSAVKYGSLEQDDTPDIVGWDRDKIANHENWNGALNEKALKHAKKSYFSISDTNTFRGIKSALWRHKQLIISGCKWRNSWDNGGNGIIPYNYEFEGFGHAIIIKGFKEIDGIEYLALHLSNGINIGDKGMFYMSEEVANKELKYGNFILIDMSPDEARKQAWSWWQKVVAFFKYYINELIK